MNDRNLDAQVAEKVFGFKWVEWGYSGGPVCRILVTDSIIEARGWVCSPAKPETPVFDDWDKFTAHYSSSISDAFLVVEKMSKLGFTVRLESRPGGVWECTFRNPWQHWQEAETLPIAICRAALSALNSQEANE